MQKFLESYGLSPEMAEILCQVVTIPRQGANLKQLAFDKARELVAA